MYPFHPVADAQHPFVPNEINQRQFSAPYSPPLTQLVFWKVCCDFFFTLFSICHNVKLCYYSNKTYNSLMIKLIILFLVVAFISADHLCFRVHIINISNLQLLSIQNCQYSSQMYSNGHHHHNHNHRCNHRKYLVHQMFLKMVFRGNALNGWSTKLFNQAHT